MRRAHGRAWPCRWRVSVQSCWVAELRAGGGYRMGDEIESGPGDVAAGSKVIARRDDGRPVLRER